MSTGVGEGVSKPSSMIRREIVRFLEAARQRSDGDRQQRRRAERRYHRSWPLLVSLNGRPFAPNVSAALHNASDTGIAFLSPMSIPADTTVYLKLFSHDDFCPRVPAIVRHTTPNGHGFLIGCEFDLSNPQICAHALELGRRSRPCNTAY